MASRSLRALALLVGAACSRLPRARPPMHPETPPGAWYVVAPGETLAHIARRAGVPAEDILELNGLARAEDVRPGRFIFVMEPQGTTPATRARASDERGSGPAPPAPRTAAGAAAFRWPLLNVAPASARRSARAGGSRTRGSICRRRSARPCSRRPTAGWSTPATASAATAT